MLTPGATPGELRVTVPFQFPAGLLADTFAPVCTTVAFHNPVICCPFANDHVKVHPLMADAPLLVIFTSAVKPVFH